jgi:cardiolipin synthase (CMP-forming)
MNRESERFWTWSNVVSIIRLLLTVPIVWLLWNDRNVEAVVVSLAAAATDWVDGRLARATHTVSEWGKILDPIADKVLVGAVVVVMLLQQIMPAWFVISVLARDLIIIVGGLVARRHTPVVLPSLMSGKLAVSAISLAGVFGILRWDLPLQLAIGLSCVLMAVSLWDYGKRLHGILRQTQTKAR